MNGTSNAFVNRRTMTLLLLLTRKLPANGLYRPLFCIHLASLLYAISVYQGHANDSQRPSWLKLKGTRFMSEKTLLRAGIRRNWIDYLNVMVSLDDIDDNILLQNLNPKKRGPKRKE